MIEKPGRFGEGLLWNGGAAGAVQEICLLSKPGCMAKLAPIAG